MKLIPIPKSEQNGRRFYRTASGRHYVYRDGDRWVITKVGETRNEVIETVKSLDEARSFLNAVDGA